MNVKYLHLGGISYRWLQKQLDPQTVLFDRSVTLGLIELLSFLWSVSIDPDEFFVRFPQ